MISWGLIPLFFLHGISVIELLFLLGWIVDFLTVALSSSFSAIIFLIFKWFSYSLNKHIIYKLLYKVYYYKYMQGTIRKHMYIYSAHLYTYIFLYLFHECSVSFYFSMIIRAYIFELTPSYIMFPINVFSAVCTFLSFESIIRYMLEWRVYCFSNVY